MLRYEYLLAKIGFETAESETSTICQCLQEKCIFRYEHAFCWCENEFLSANACFENTQLHLSSSQETALARTQTRLQRDLAASRQRAEELQAEVRGASFGRKRFFQLLKYGHFLLPVSQNFLSRRAFGVGETQVALLGCNKRLKMIFFQKYFFDTAVNESNAF